MLWSRAAGRCEFSSCNRPLASAQLMVSCEAARAANAKLPEFRGLTTRLKNFPAVPVAAAVELGRTRMPNANIHLELFDQQGDQGFVPAITI